MTPLQPAIKRSKSQPPYELLLRRAHNCLAIGELTRQDIQRLRDACNDALDAIENGDL